MNISVIQSASLTVQHPTANIMDYFVRFTFYNLMNQFFIFVNNSSIFHVTMMFTAGSDDMSAKPTTI